MTTKTIAVAVVEGEGADLRHFQIRHGSHEDSSTCGRFHFMAGAAGVVMERQFRLPRD
jgi:hypothetical protein